MNTNQGDVLALLHRSNERGNVSAAPDEKWRVNSVKGL